MVIILIQNKLKIIVATYYFKLVFKYFGIKYSTIKLVDCLIIIIIVTKIAIFIILL